MNTRQYLQLESITACLGVLEDPAFKSPAITALRGKLDEAAAEIRELSSTQIGAGLSAKGATLGLAARRKDVRKRLFRVTRHATAVLEGLPGIRQDLRVPHTNAKDPELIKAVARIVKNLRPHMKSLYATGLPADAITQLEASAKKLKASSGPSAEIGRRSRATASLPGVIRRARALAKALDAAVRVELADDPQLTRWVSAYRVPRKQGRPRKKRRELSSATLH